MKNLLPSILFIRTVEVKETLLLLCQAVITGLLRLAVSGISIVPDIQDFLKSTVAVTLRGHAQEMLMKERGRFRRLYSRSTFLIADITSSLEAIQRLSTMSSPCDKELTPITPLKFYSVKKNSIEIETAQINDGEMIEIALAVAHDKDDCNFETIYRGVNCRLIQSGLSQQCSYLIKYRILKGSSKSSWSQINEFKTEVCSKNIICTKKCNDLIDCSSGFLALCF